ncbi:hypothetical protein FRC03_010230 [Tulasnella sp. 419]|nr:hypothetical protein FRC02_012253 [Tulasnella sp. 418]KAG8957352.1 hypothetical protein FRC03_010230 [Tulasnella sp. 419]
MLLSSLLVFFLAPLVVYAKLAFKSFKYAKGVAHADIKVWDNAPPQFAVNLTHPGWDCRLSVRIPGGGKMNVQVKGDVPSEPGPLDIPVPSDTPTGPGYRMKLVSNDGSGETFDTSESFEIKEGDFD